MKKIVIALLLLCSGSAFGQSTFVAVTVGFPHIVAGGDPAGTNYITLLQLVNNNSASTTGHISLFSDSGSPLAVVFDGGAPQSTLDVHLAAGETRQIQMTLNGPVTAGWMTISYTPSGALTSVILQFRSGTTLLSEIGVDPAFGPISATDFAAETSPALNTGIAVANPDTVTASILVSLWDANTGNVVAHATVAVPANGHVARFITDLFPSAPNITQIRAKISLDQCSDASCVSAGGNGFLATAVRFSSDQFTTIPVSERMDGGDQIRVLPQVAFGGPADGLNMKTILYLITNVLSGVSVTGNIFDDSGNALAASADGAPAAPSFTLTVPANGVARVVLTGDQTLHSGWVRLTLPSAVPLVDSAVFQTFVGTDLVSEASVLESPQVTRGLIYVNSQGSLENTGVALSNLQPADNTIQLELFDRNGAVFSQQQITLPPNGHLARFVTELFPELSSTDEFDGALSIHSAFAFSAVALRETGDKIAGLPIASDGMYRPSITSLRVTKTVRSPAEVDFQIDVQDMDSDLATSSSTSVPGTGYIDFGSAGYDYGPVTISATPLLNKQSGTLTGSFKPPDVTGAIPSGYQAVFYITITDSAGNTSNFVKIPVKF